MTVLKPGQPIRTTGNNLVGLWRPSFVKVDHRLFVYGGGGNVTDNLHVLNLHTMRWDTVQNVKGTPPCKRYGHTATLWNNCIVIFGGCNERAEYCNDVHIFDLEKSTWHQPNIIGEVPARYLHSAVVNDNKLFVYGGFARNAECTYVLDELSILDLQTFTWTKFNGVPPRYNHSATLIGQKMYIYAGKDEHGNTVSDLFVINVGVPPYTPHLVLSGSQSSASSRMVLLKSQHFCEAVCGKLLVFGRYLANGAAQHHHPNAAAHHHHQLTNPDAVYGLWMLDLDTLEWQRQDCNANFEVGGWNYFTVVTETIDSAGSTDDASQVTVNNLFFLGNTEAERQQGYDHFRDALVINGESLGLYDIPPPQFSHEFAQLLNNPELSDFVIVASNGQELHVHQVILITRWPHFRNIYKSGMIEAQQRRMEIPEPYEVVLALLKYLYSDRLDDDVPWQVVCEVLVVANMYLLNRLKKICCERLYKRHMTVETCGLIFEKAITAEETGLKMLALDFMFRNYGSVLKSEVLLHMSSSVRQEFMEAVPDEAVLEVSSRSSGRSLSVAGKCISSQQIATATMHRPIASAASSTNLSLQPQQQYVLSYSADVHNHQVSQASLGYTSTNSAAGVQRQIPIVSAQQAV